MRARGPPRVRTSDLGARRSGEVWVLIATDMLARGMDFKGVNLIINYDFPQVRRLRTPRWRLRAALAVARCGPGLVACAYSRAERSRRCRTYTASDARGARVRAGHVAWSE